jgi:hypothetical protein
LIAVSLVLSAIITPIFTKRLAVSSPDAGRLGLRVLLVLPSHQALRRGVAEIAARLAKSDDGIVVPVVIVLDHDRPDESSWRRSESMLVLLGVDRPVEVFVDTATAEGIRHAAGSFGCTSVVIDDLDGNVQDDFNGAKCGEPILFVGPLNHTRFSRAAVDGERNHDKVLIDLAGRLAQSTGSLDGNDKCDLIVQAADADRTNSLSDRTASFVRVLCAAE